MKNAPVEYLEILIDALIAGDGQTIEHTNTTNYVYTTISEQLADDMQEISFKAGFNVRKIMHVDSSKNENSNSRELYRVKLSKGEWSKGNEPRIKKEHISKQHYSGKVWCYTVPNGFFVTRRNGKITIQGNSGYQSAQVGVETLIRRIESWRHTLANWCEENIFKPIAEMQGFIDKEESEEVGESVYLYPTIKWNDLNLKDQTQWHQILMQLHDKQVISTQTLMEEMDLNYDQEVKRMRYEQNQGSLGAAAGGMMGGTFGAGGMPAGGGGIGGAMGDIGTAGGIPGGDMGGGVPGGTGLGGDMGGGLAPAGGMSGMSASGGKVMKKGKGKQQDDKEVMPAPMIKLTSIEQRMAGLLVDVAEVNKLYTDTIRVQFPVQNPLGGKPNVLDFAIPHLKIGIECDGEIWHSQPEQSQSDQERDQLLAQRGWTILRFDDKTIDDAPQAVKSTITDFVQKSIKSKNQKTASIQNSGIHLYSLRRHNLIDLGINYNLYNKGRSKYTTPEFGTRNNNWNYRNSKEF